MYPSSDNCIVVTIQDVVLSEHLASLDLALAGEMLHAIVDRDAHTQSALIPGRRVQVHIPPTAVMLSRDAPLGTDNVLLTHVAEISVGAVHAEVRVQLQQGSNLSALVTREAILELGLMAGDSVYFIVPATQLVVYSRPLS